MKLNRIEGNCDARFERVRQAFAENFEKRGEVGAAAAVTIDGRPVVDLWGGHADKARTRPWSSDTIVNVYSATKGVAATCLNQPRRKSGVRLHDEPDGIPRLDRSARGGAARCSVRVDLVVHFWSAKLSAGNTNIAAGHNSRTASLSRNIGSSVGVKAGV
jgi:hypothetical protein